ncbi:MAG: helix-hairpin-helix domain-containing protein [Lachnospiraceae bacterium]|jgi:competence protein ComEA|nr:helix-hairpin-helix domain-containing protein [Lachnospiraceae bacterium]
MYKKLSITLFCCLTVLTVACGKKQYDIDLLSPVVEGSSATTKTEEVVDELPLDEALMLSNSTTEAADLSNQEPNGTSGSGSDEDSVCFVHICGAVMNPGVYEVATGSRIFELLELAGGFTAEASVDTVNLAMVVSDGSQIQIPTRSEAADTDKLWITGGNTNGNSDNKAATSLTGMVNINTATADLLMTLPGIGRAKADSIIEYRNEHGYFARIEDIMNITGIKEGVFGNIKDMICV